MLPESEGAARAAEENLLGRFLLLVAKGEQLVEDARKIAEELEAARRLIERLLPRTDDPRYKQTGSWR